MGTARAVLTKRLFPVAVLLASILASYTVAVLVQMQPTPTSAAVQASVGDGDEAPSNPFASANGTHLIAFVLSSSTCPWSTRPATKQALGSIRDKLRSAYGESYAQVSVIGVALDRDLEAGLSFLSELGGGQPAGAFDQIIVGGSWLNEQVVRLVWRNGTAAAMTPQVVVVERSVNTDSYPAMIAFQADQLVVNPSGRAEILDWMRKGVPLEYVPFRVPSAE